MATNQQVTQSGMQEGSRGMGLLECPGLNKARRSRRRSAASLASAACCRQLEDSRT